MTLVSLVLRLDLRLDDSSDLLPGHKPGSREIPQDGYRRRYRLLAG